MPTHTSRCFALIPAAGKGSRVGAGRPKQYEQVAGRCVIDWTLDAFRACESIVATYVVLAPDDQSFTFHARNVVPLHVGGVSRRDSVLAGLNAIASDVKPDDWILVHDAARPGLTVDLLSRLIGELIDDAVGGLLAVPVPDTVKRMNDQRRVHETVPRDGLWLAQTPQMFRYELLKRALDALPNATDEASAVEALGLAPKLVQGSARNSKITYREDLELAAHWLL
ncbi:MAG TPA: 2-C-methyl-D-erythritol 4-phosphate cytidylyltransferase [Burkholderiaceae bacterium]|nr:2-C-methyl-D-erythritol 4-phosphate cytidylyltransferase [Burkholderiaceae bacterium]